MTKEEILQTFSDINHAYNNSTKYDTLKRMLDELTEPCMDNGVFIGRWIPVSESLPEKNVWVLVTVEQYGNRYQDVMRRNNYIEAWTDNIDNYTDEITAWMPLPEPYKAESED